ncbi:DNA alkylation repair protein [Klebsiella oxytoca]|uniref:DNA alkylation repair protein n=1 Tax=Klebsiella oxytoca TaxID=571 RepID=A0A6B8MUK3_KLEOX|nr:DNA alkylation repair protein [Klebsiella oxytoca]QGN38003.1 DNA alkylation repair protein [Klebsiella oxytoca]
MAVEEKRKGATRIADIADDILQALSQGKLQSANLTEVLAIDQLALLQSVFPDLPAASLQVARTFAAQGIVKRMAGIAHLLLSEYGEEGIARSLAHGSDTVRGWACFMLGAAADLTLDERLNAIYPLADDDHFGVREWAWLALRPHLARELDLAFELLAPWTSSSSERIRRFACESLRPRGVWCAHLGALKQQPQRALAILTPLRADPSAYVQDSVANWLNDAGKDNPDWVRALCAQWLAESPSPATQRICQRAMRNLT